MTGLQSILNEVFDLIVEPLAISIGIRKAVRLRTVSRAFGADILHAICDRQVVDIYDPATPELYKFIGPEIR
ncbi:ankyrin repeat-containing domain protein [Apiospora arundinis]